MIDQRLRVGGSQFGAEAGGDFLGALEARTADGDGASAGERLERFEMGGGHEPVAKHTKSDHVISIGHAYHSTEAAGVVAPRERRATRQARPMASRQSPAHSPRARE